MFEAGAWYGEAYPDGATMAFTPFKGFVLARAGERLEIGLPPGQPWGLTFPRFHPFPLQIAGQPHEPAAETPWFHDGKWDTKAVTAFGVNSVIFRNGTLQVNTGQVSAQGWRYVDPLSGELVKGDDTLRLQTPLGLIHEYTRLSNGWLVGQGHETDCVLWDGTLFRVVHPGSARFIRVIEDVVSGKIGIALTTLEGVEFYWHTFASLSALPPQVFFDPPQKDPIDPPKDPIVPDIPNYAGVVARVRAKYPRANPGGFPLGEDHWRFLVDLAQQTNTKLFVKPGGAGVLIPALGVRVSQDIIGRGSMGDAWADILGDAEGQAVPTWDAKPGAAGDYLDVSLVSLGGVVVDPPPPPPVDDTALKLLTTRVTLLERLWQQLQEQSKADAEEIAKLKEKVSVLEARPAGTSTPRRFRVEGKTAVSFGHNHTIALDVKEIL